MTWTGIKNFLRNWDLHLEFATGTLVFVAAILAIFGVTTQRVILAAIGWSVAGISAVMVREHRERRGLMRRNKVFPDEDKVFDQLVQFVETHEIGRAVFLQYSGTQCRRVLDAILRKKGVTAELFIQHEERADAIHSKRQVGLIKSSTENLIKRNETVPGTSAFKIYKFRVPVSMRAILIDDKVLCAGWYTFEAKDRSGKRVFPDDPVTVAGKDRPALLAWNGTEDFEILRGMIESLAASYREDPDIEEVQM
jgi:hypothetical protein